MQLMVEGLKILRQIVYSDAFNEFPGEEIARGSSIARQSNRRLYSANVRYGMASCWDVQNGDRMAVVDPQLKV